MKWFIVIWACTNCSGDPFINPNFNPSTIRQQIEMPSEGVCRAVQALNHGTECWAKAADVGNVVK